MRVISLLFSDGHFDALELIYAACLVCIIIECSCLLFLSALLEYVVLPMSQLRASLYKTNKWNCLWRDWAP